MFEHYTERARQVVVLAQQEARGLGHNYIGTEHILIALTREPKLDWPARYLNGIGVDPGTTRDRTLGIRGKGTHDSDAQIPFTARAKKVLELAQREARGFNHPSVGTEHLLLALVREGEGVGARVLRDLGGTPEVIRSAVSDWFAANPGLFPAGPFPAEQRSRSASPPPRGGAFHVEPDLALSRTLMAAAARALQEGRQQYSIEDLNAVLDQAPPS